MGGRKEGRMAMGPGQVQRLRLDIYIHRSRLGSRTEDGPATRKEENEIREVIKPAYNLLAVFHGIFQRLKSPESEEDKDINTNLDVV